MKLDKKLSRRTKGLKKKSSKKTRKNVNQRGGYDYESISFTVNNITFERIKKASFFSSADKFNIASPLTFDDIQTFISMLSKGQESITDNITNKALKKQLEGGQRQVFLLNLSELTTNLIIFIIQLYDYHQYLDSKKKQTNHTKDRKTNIMKNIHILLFVLSELYYTYDSDNKMFESITGTKDLSATGIECEKKEICKNFGNSFGIIVCKIKQIIMLYLNKDIKLGKEFNHITTTLENFTTLFPTNSSKNRKDYVTDFFTNIDEKAFLTMLNTMDDKTNILKNINSPDLPELPESINCPTIINKAPTPPAKPVRPPPPPPPPSRRLPQQITVPESVAVVPRAVAVSQKVANTRLAFHNNSFYRIEKGIQNSNYETGISHSNYPVQTPYQIPPKRLQQEGRKQAFSE
jgi:hypothetical protein